MVNRSKEIRKRFQSRTCVEFPNLDRQAKDLHSLVRQGLRRLN